MKLDMQRPDYVSLDGQLLSKGNLADADGNLHRLNKPVLKLAWAYPNCITDAGLRIRDIKKRGYKSRSCPTFFQINDESISTEE